MTNPGDATNRLDDLDTLARRHGVLPVFRWTDEVEGELEGCFLRLDREDADGHGMLVLDIGAVDGTWRDRFLVGARDFESAASGLAERYRSD